MPADVYQPSDPNPGLTPLPSAQASTQTAQALGGLGSEMEAMSYRLQRARDATEELNAKAQLLQAHSTLETQYKGDADWQSAPQRYAADVGEATGSILDAARNKMSPQAYAAVAFENTRWGIASKNAVDNAVLVRQGSQNTANLANSVQALNNNYLNAGSDPQRDAIEHSVDGMIQPMVAGGWMSAADGQARGAAIKSSLQEARVAQLMQANPELARAALAPDSGQFPLIPPQRRVALLAGADAAVDETAHLKIGVLAQQDPAAAAATVGRIGVGPDSNGVMRVSSPAQAAAIFDHGVIQQESGGRVDVPDSSAGAVGLTQMMPGTARAAAERMGLKDIAGLSDDDLKARLRGDGKLALALGHEEWNALLVRYDGSIPAALAGYNAGRVPADKWYAAAKAQYGDNFTPAQFAALIPAGGGYQETRDYIPAVYAHLKAPIDAFGLSGDNAMLRARSTVLGIGQQEQARQQQILNNMASLSRVNDPVAQFFPNGNTPDPPAAAAYRETQLTAALAGGAEAAQAVRNFDMAQRNAPVMRAAYQMPPAQLEGAIASLQQRIDNAPGVTPIDREQLATLKTVQANVNASKATNPIGLAEMQGAFKPVSVQAQQIGTPDFATALDARNGQALAAANAYDGHLMPFKPEEADALKTAFAKAGPAQKAAMAATLATHLTDPEVFSAAMKQIAGDDRLVQVAGQLGGQNPALAQKILTGAEMIADKGVENKVAPVREAITAALPVGLFPNVQTQSDVAKAALAVYAANQGANHALIDKDDANGIKAAMEEVTGPQITLNGRATPVPPGFSQGAVSRGLSALTAADLKPFGGLQPGVDPAWLGAHAQLLPLKLGGSEYQVLVNGARVSDAGGAPLRIDLKQLAAAQAVRLKGATDKGFVDENTYRQTDPASQLYGGGL